MQISTTLTDDHTLNISEMSTISKRVFQMKYLKPHISIETLPSLKDRFAKTTLAINRLQQK